MYTILYIRFRPPPPPKKHPRRTARALSLRILRSSVPRTFFNQANIVIVVRSAESTRHPPDHSPPGTAQATGGGRKAPTLKNARPLSYTQSTKTNTFFLSHKTVQPHPPTTHHPRNHTTTTTTPHKLRRLIGCLQRKQSPPLIWPTQNLTQRAVKRAPKLKQTTVN